MPGTCNPAWHISVRSPMCLVFKLQPPASGGMGRIPKPSNLQCCPLAESPGRMEPGLPRTLPSGWLLLGMVCRSYKGGSFLHGQGRGVCAHVPRLIKKQTFSLPADSSGIHLRVNKQASGFCRLLSTLRFKIPVTSETSVSCLLVPELALLTVDPNSKFVARVKSSWSGCR